MTFYQLTEEYHLFMRKNGRKDSSITRYLYDINSFLNWLQTHQNVSKSLLKELDSNDIEQYLSSLKSLKRYKNSTLKQKYIHIKSFLDYFNAKIEVNKYPSSNLKESNFATDEEIHKLLAIIKSYDGLSENQATGRPYIINRNTLLVHFMLFYGLSINDLVTLTMKNVNLGTGVITPGKDSSLPRQIQLSKEDQKLLFTYYKEIPDILRPQQHSDHSLFIAFDFARKAFRWDYSLDAPKPFTKVAIQRMLQKENKRANIHVTPTSLRNRFILNALRNEVDPLQIKLMLGLKSSKSLYPYIDFFNEPNGKGSRQLNANFVR
ncbi:site-specific integrase [Bacillus sp. SM-B1]|uniref:tyrosine-type recombinase/integrase n=1 Tax=Bacillus sp. SM-B1 TaxID=2980102 RepID=UPI00294A692E|nr:site-specific integrase [Bacillus sp. SM-B1]MDV6040212.1 site-specific integrase [Bacillus sp. SM-B1]